MPFLTCYRTFKLLFIALLFGIFVGKFAIPSVEKYMEYGILVEKSPEPRKSEDTPMVTICAKNNNTRWGWKNTLLTGNIFKTYCNCSSVEDFMACLQNGTFNLNETILKVNTDLENVFWSQDIWVTSTGKMLIIIYE